MITPTNGTITISNSTRRISKPTQPECLSSHRNTMTSMAWVLRDPTVASTLIGASSVAQLDENLGALANLHFTQDELSEIDQYASDSGVDLWRESSDN